MKRTHSHPVILPLPIVAATMERPATVRFPRRRSFRRGRAGRVARPTRSDDVDDALAQMRDRLLKMILANEWDRSHGHRAS
jgi:hypothetical protein